METINARITVAQMTESEWNANEVVLLKGEIGVASDTQVIKVGDGTSVWTNLKSHQGEKGDPLIVTSTTRNSQGDTVIEFDDGSSATVSKGDKGDSIIVSSTSRDSQGNTVISFSDGSNVTVNKGDSITVSSTSRDSQGNTVISFSDGSSATVDKGDKGDPLTFDDLTPEQINQIKAPDVDLSNYATRDHTHKIADVTGLQGVLDGKASSTHTHDEYLEKGEPIELTSAQKSELKGDRGEKGDSITVSSTSRDSQGNTVISFSDGSSVTISKGDKGDQGIQGATGDRGAQGNQGIPGRNGTSITTWVGTQNQYDSINYKSSTMLYLIKG